MNKPLVLATTIAALLAAKASHAADIYWDGTGTSWNTPSSWSTASNATTPNPAAVPGANDIAFFHTTGVTGPLSITLDGPQSVLGLATTANNKFLTTIVGGGTNQVLSIGTGGIDHRFGGLNIGSATDGQQVDVLLLGSQTWTSSSSNTQNAVAINAYNNVSLANAGSQTLTLDGTTTGGGIHGVISDGEGILNLTKTHSSGRWTLSGENTYTGVTTISAGTLAVSTIGNGGEASNLGAASSAASNLVFDGGILFYTGATASTDRSFTINADKTGTFDIESSATTLTFSGTSPVTTGKLTKAGLGTLEFSGAHGYSGTTLITRGNLTLSGAGSIANSAITIGQNGSGTTMNTIVNSAALTISGEGGTVARGGDLTINGGVLSNAHGARTLLVTGFGNGDSNDTFGTLNLNNGSFWGKVASHGFTHAQVTFSSLARTAGSQMHFDTNFEPLGSTPIASAAAGRGNVVFTTGPTLVGGTLGTPSAGIIPFATVGGLPATYDSTHGLRALDASTEMAEISSATTGQNAKLTTPGTTTLNADKTVNSLWGHEGTLALGTRTLTVTSGAVVASGGSYTIGASANDGTVAFDATEGNVMVGNDAVLTINSVITGSNGLTIGLTDSDSSAGTLVLGGANTFTGTTTITGNHSGLRLTLAHPLALQGTTLNYHSYGAGLRFGANDTAKGLVFDLTSATIGALVGGQGLALTNSGPSGGGVALTVGSDLNSENSTFNGTISGAGSLIKDGSGTLTLSGGANNTYTGSTTIRGGILKLNKVSGSTTYTAIPGDLTIESGGKLQYQANNLHHQIADSANVVMSGAGSAFNGTGTNVAVAAITDTFASLTVTGGSVNAGMHATGIIVTGMASFTGGAGRTVFLGNSSSRFTVGGLTLKDMTQIAGSTVDTPNSFSVYGNNGSTRSRLTIGDLGLTLDNSILSMRHGGNGTQGSQLVLNGDVTTVGTSPSTILRDFSGGSGGQVSMDLSDKAGIFNRTFNIGGGGADLKVDVPILNGAATTAAITKAGPGTLTLIGASTYNGGTTISEGTLLANNTSGSATGTGLVAVSLNGTLGGTGTVSGAVTVAAGGALLGGTGLEAVGTLSLAGNVSLLSDSEIKLTLGADGAHSSLTRTGGLWSFAPAQAFSFIDLGAEVGLYEDIIVGLTSAPAGIDQWTITNAGFVGTFTYDAGTIDLNLTAVPEPTTLTTLLGGLGLLAGFRRFGRRRG